MKEIDEFISRLYRATPRIALEHFRAWALDALKEVFEFDAAIWSTGHLSTRRFHTHTTLALPLTFADLLIDHLPINPISKVLFQRAGQAVDMREVLSDDLFFDSAIYHTVFEPHGIQRVLSSIHIAPRSGIYTLLSVYRFDRRKQFTEHEKEIHQRALFHLLESASHACMLSLKDENETNDSTYAICDRHGIYHEVEPTFLDLIEAESPDSKAQIFPLALPLTDNRQVLGNTIFSSEKLGDLYRVKARTRNPLDELTQRELEVVYGVTKGLSFKLIAKELNLSPSTISNHLYRIYHKLGINSRAELALLVK